MKLGLTVCQMNKPRSWWPKLRRSIEAMSDEFTFAGRDVATEEWDRLVARDRNELAVAEPDREIAVGDLIYKARMRAGQFVDQGVVPGDRVIVARPNVIEFVVDYLAVRLCGAILVNQPWRAGNNIVQLAEILEARLVVLTEDLVGDNPIFDNLGPKRFKADKLAAIGPERPEPKDASELAWLACTSGTTGAPKAAMHTGATWERQTRVFAEHFGLTREDPIFVCSPVGHAIAVLFGVRFSLLLNSPMILIPRWNADTAANLIGKYGCTFAAGPTPFVHDLVEYAELNGPEKLNTLKFFPSGGAPVPRPLVKRGYEALPNCQVWSYFGTSEAGACTAIPLDSELDIRLMTDGIALPETTTRVIDGELQIYSPYQMMKGYWAGDPKKRLHADGWYQTGDACKQLDNNYIQMAGRAEDIILRGGENISPLEIENSLLTIDGVHDIAIIGYPDDRLGSRISAVVVETSPVSLEELRDRCEKVGLDKAKWPEYKVTIDKIPLSNVGKVMRYDLEDYVVERRKSEGL
ncbi:MAG: AMP-binding protein [Pseudomonadota bacterium]